MLQAIVLGYAFALSAPAQDPAWLTPGRRDAFLSNHQFQDSMACVRCHAQPTVNDIPPAMRVPGRPYSFDFVWLSEYAIWKTHDKHAQAYAVLKGKRGQDIGKILGQDVTVPATGCLNCHGQNALSERSAGSLDISEGIGCASCHGPSSSWVGPHANVSWREKTPLQKAESGMRNLRDPEVRSTLCVSCHIGNAEEGKVVTHAMFAAGHPPLPPIEIATFSRNEPPHYRESLDVPFLKSASPEVQRRYHAETFQMTRLALVGALVSLRETARLTSERTSFDIKDTKQELVRWPELAVRDADEPTDPVARRKARWPELALATSDCYACHHDLQYPGYRQTRGYGYHLPGKPRHRVFPGRVMVRMWATTLAGAAAQLAGKEHLDAIDGALVKLAAATTTQQFGDPEGLKQASLQLEKACEAAIKSAKTAPLDKAKVQAILKMALDGFTEPGMGRPDQPVPDFEAARQLASLADVIASDMKNDRENAEGSRATLAKLTDLVDLHPYANRQARLGVILSLIEREQKLPKGATSTFSEYLKANGPVEMARKLVDDRDFLPSFNRIRSEDFNKWLSEDATATKLQHLDDEEERKLMSRLNAYDPAAFLKLARELAEQVGR